MGPAAALNEVPDWADIPPEVKIENLEGPLFAYFKPPQSNNVDTDDKTGVSVYGGSAVDLIQRADEQWDLIRWEYKSGQRKIFMDATETVARDFDKRLFEIAPFSKDGKFLNSLNPLFGTNRFIEGYKIF